MPGHERTVDTTAGKLKGLSAGGVSTFLGIPYGDSVSGDRRFTAPRPYPAWAGVRDAVTFGPAAPQSDPRIGCTDEFDRFEASDGVAARRGIPAGGRCAG